MQTHTFVVVFSVVVVLSQFAVHFNGSAEGTYPALQVQAPVFLFQVVLVVSQDGPGAINGLFDYSTVGSERISSVESNGSGKVRPLSFFFSSVVQSDMKFMAHFRGTSWIRVPSIN